MIAVQLNELELIEARQDQEPSHHWTVQFPLAGTPETSSLGSVYFEIEPGRALPTHTDSRDEIVVLISGHGEGTIGDETRELSAGGMVFIPAMAPHGFRNTGTEIVRALGIFAGADVVSEFEHVCQPFGIRVFDMAQVPAGSDQAVG